MEMEEQAKRSRGKRLGGGGGGGRGVVPGKRAAQLLKLIGSFSQTRHSFQVPVSSLYRSLEG